MGFDSEKPAVEFDGISAAPLESLGVALEDVATGDRVVLCLFAQGGHGFAVQIHCHLAGGAVHGRRYMLPPAGLQACGGGRNTPLAHNQAQGVAGMRVEQKTVGTTRRAFVEDTPGGKR